MSQEAFVCGGTLVGLVRRGVYEVVFTLCFIRTISCWVLAAKSWSSVSVVATPDCTASPSSGIRHLARLVTTKRVRSGFQPLDLPFFFLLVVFSVLAFLVALGIWLRFGLVACTFSVGVGLGDPASHVLLLFSSSSCPAEDLLSLSHCGRSDGGTKNLLFTLSSQAVSSFPAVATSSRTLLHTSLASREVWEVDVLAVQIIFFFGWKGCQG